MKKIALLVIVTLLLASCSNVPTSNPQATIEAVVNATLSSIPTNTPQPISTLPPTSTSDNWLTYSSSEYGFSIRYPSDLEITPSDKSASLYIGKKMQIRIGDVDPLECQGDCPVIENTESVTIAGTAVTRVTGYIGSIGGNNPQHYMSIIFPHNSLYYTFTLYALEFDASLINPPPSTIAPLVESDIILFEQMVDTVSFSN